MNKIDVPSLWSEQMGAAVAKQQELAADAYSTDQTFEEMRLAYNTERRFWNEGGPTMAETWDARVATPHGDVSVRSYRPVAQEILPVIFYIHGGGWVLGNLDTHDRVCRMLADRTGANVIAIDYTLAPEAKYPQAVEECVAVIQSVRADASDWGIDASDYSIAGDSGGAHLSLASYLYLRDELKEGKNCRSLLLFYGYYGLRDSASMRLLGGSWDGLSEADFQWYKSLFLAREEDAYAPYFDLLSNDLSEMPACHVVGLELDPLVDDSRTLINMLRAQNQRVEYNEIPGVIHGFIHHTRMVDAAVDMLESAADFYKTR